MKNPKPVTITNKKIFINKSRGGPVIARINFMSKTDLKQLFAILAANKFSFEICKNEGLTVTYQTGKSQGKFKLMLDAFEGEQLSEIFAALNGPNKTGGTIPAHLTTKADLLLKKSKEENEKVKPLYKVTKERVYFDRERMKLLYPDIETINISDKNTITATKVTSDLKGFNFIRHNQLVKDGPNFSFYHDDFATKFIVSVNTDEWQADRKKDALNIFIKKVQALKADQVKILLDKVFKNCIDNATKPLADKIKPAEPQPEPQAAPIKATEPLTKENVKAEFARITKLIKGNEEQMIFESWGPDVDVITRKWDGKNLLTVSFEVEGFLFAGTVSVTKLHDRGTFTVSLLTGKKPGKVVKVVEKVKGEDLNGLIDMLVECDNYDAWQQKMNSYYNLDEKKAA